MTKLDNAHFNMLEQQVRPSDVLDPRVLDALSCIDRADFVDESLAGLAYADTDLPIGFGQVILSPVVQGRLLQALNVQADEDVLEIGTGSGYFTALLATLANYVTSIEVVPELSALAGENLAKAKVDNVQLMVGDASHDCLSTDRVKVIISTAALTKVPDAFLQSVSVGGRILAVVGEGDAMTVQQTHRINEREWQTTTLFETVVPEMINAEAKPVFEF